MKFRHVVINNAVQSLATILRAMNHLKINFVDAARIIDSKIFFSLVENISDEEGLSPELADIMKRLWLDHGVQVCFSRSREYQLNDSAP
jgi:hypothetical protein